MSRLWNSTYKRYIYTPKFCEVCGQVLKRRVKRCGRCKPRIDPLHQLADGYRPKEGK